MQKYYHISLALGGNQLKGEKSKAIANKCLLSVS